jgi:transposase
MDIRALSRQGYTYAEIGRLVGRDWRTVKRYLESGAQPVYRRKRMPSKLDPLKPLIDQWLAAEPRLLATRVHQDLVRDYGFDGSYNTVRRYVERSRPKPPRRAEERFETAPGFQAQVDWSHEQPIRTSSGLELPLYCFHMVLGHSRDAFCALTGSQDLVTFWSCHRQAFAHFGGVPRELLYDRTKTVVRTHRRQGRVAAGAAVSPGGARLGAPVRVLDAALSGLPRQDQGKGRARRVLGPGAAAARAQLHRLRAGEHRLASVERGRRPPAPARHPRRDRRDPGRARPSGALAAATDRLPGRRAHHPRRGAGRVLQLRRPPLPRPGRHAGRAGRARPRARRAGGLLADRWPPDRPTRARPPRPRAPGSRRELDVAGQGAGSAAGHRGAPPAAVGLSGADRWQS